MKSLHAFFSLIFLSGLLVACATQPVVECKSLDWFELGRRDGAIGLLPNAFVEHTETCSGPIKKDANSIYQNGRNKGLTSFCSTKNGWETGRSGRPYQNVCPRSFEGTFRQGYDPGIQTFEIEQEIQLISHQLKMDQLDFRQRHDLNQRIVVLENRLQDIKKPASIDFQYEAASSSN